MRIFASTPRYFQGPGALAHVGRIATEIGEQPAIVIDAQIRSLVDDALMAGFPTPPPVHDFAGEVTDANVASIVALLNDVDVVVAVGGGKALDAGKAVALQCGLPIICVPTIASTDGPASRGIAMYDDTHKLIRVDQMPLNPAAVIVDSQVIAAAPARFLRAGIGDAIAKAFEAEGCWAGGGLTKHGTRPTHAARAIARAAYRMLRAHAPAGIAAATRHEITEDLEATIEAAVLLSAMGFENGGLSIAHSATRGLMTLPGARDRLHGEHVAYGTMLHLAVDGGSDSALEDMADFLRSVGLPTTLKELGATGVEESDTLAGIAAAIMKSPHIGNLGVAVTAPGLVEAMRRVEAVRWIPVAVAGSHM